MMLNTENVSNALCDVMCKLYSDLVDYCGKCVYRLGRDAEGPLVNKGVLFQCLECEGSIVFLDRGSNPISVMMFKFLSAMGDKVGRVNILLKPGHYDLLYIHGAE